MRVERAVLLGEGGGIDAVETMGVIVNGELLLPSPRLATRRRSCRQTEVLKDAPRDRAILDGGYQLHPAGASRAFENVEAEGSSEQHRPCKTALPPRVVGAGEIVTERRASPKSSESLSPTGL